MIGKNSSLGFALYRDKFIYNMSSSQKKKRESNLRLFKIVWGCKWTSSFDLAYLPITQIYNTDVEEQIKNIKKTVHPKRIETLLTNIVSLLSKVTL